MAEEFDLAINPDADVLSASILSLARAQDRRGYVSDGRGGLRPLNAAALAWWSMGLDDALKQQNRSTYGEWLHAICELSAPVTAPSLAISPASHDRAVALFARDAPAARQRVCFNTGAGDRWREKRWKLRHFGVLAESLTTRVPGTAIILVGGPGEVEFNHDLMSNYPGFVDAGVLGSVEDVGALMAGCDWVLTADSLGYHVASAVGIPAVCLVGPTAPWELDRFDRNLVLYSDAECVACYRARCPLTLTCMDALTPAAVLAQIEYSHTAQGPTMRIPPGLVTIPVDGLPAPLVQVASDRGGRLPLRNVTLDSSPPAS